MIFYEPHRANPINGIYHQRNLDLRAGEHLHDSFEWICVEEGEIQAYVDGRWFSVFAGESILIFPNRVHSVRTPKTSKTYLCVFENSLVSEFYCKIRDLTVETPVFTLSDQGFSKQLEQSDSSRFLLKSCLYRLVDRFEQSVGAYFVNQNRPAEHVGQVLHYVSMHFREPITMKDVGKEMGYDYHYLSNLLQKELRTTFRSILNEYRISYAKHLLVNGEERIVEIAGSCGYESLCSFNRNFKLKEGITPSEYRWAHRA